MYTNVNLAAPIGALLFLGTAFLIICAALLLLYSLFTKRFSLAKISALAIALIAALYLSLLLLFSWTSTETMLARGEEKHFCEIDCHLAYSVLDSQTTKTLGTQPNQLTATGLFRVIKIKTRFDEKTISPTRGDSLLYPNSRALVVVDAQGKEYFPSAAAERLLQDLNEAGKPFSTPLRPGETYQTTVVFDLPADIKSPTLLVHEGESETRFVIGHENSLLHKKTRFQI
ncbi:MAG TPA: hypothetical protein VHR36_16700 [Pyrinomonadaceae bacterium]|jgi:hypothetical protein|nr:hypothetical protein [Pyrinomonadaceae bacterium]